MDNTTFKNCTGLPEEGHLTTARDISKMSAELLKHRWITEFTTTWMDSVRDGEFGLNNTNKLVRFYEGTTGLKTGFTTQALYCLSASAQREGMELIAVVLKAPSSDERFASAKALLNYGFANYALMKTDDGTPLPDVAVTLGRSETVKTEPDCPDALLVEKRLISSIEREMIMEESVDAPVKKGQKLGQLNFVSEGKMVYSADIIAAEDVEKLSVWDIYIRMVKGLFA